MKTHFVRYRSGKHLYACGNDGSGLMRRDGFFNCKKCLRVVTSKSWSMMFNHEYALTKYREDIDDKGNLKEETDDKAKT